MIIFNQLLSSSLEGKTFRYLSVNKLWRNKYEMDAIYKKLEQNKIIL